MFPGKLTRVAGPEQKPRSSARHSSIGGVDFLAQGTLYPDVIESLNATGGPSVTIKAHHNGAIRIPGEVTKEWVHILQRADAVFLDEIRKAGPYNGIWQAIAVLLPVKTVGVMGDARSYDNVCALRAVTSTDGMMADYHQFLHEVLGRTATRIINEVRGIHRVV